MIEYTKEELAEKEREETRKYLGYLQRSIKEKAQIKKSLDFVYACQLCPFYSIGSGKTLGCEECVFGQFMRSVL